MKDFPSNRLHLWSLLGQSGAGRVTPLFSANIRNAAERTGAFGPQPFTSEATSNSSRMIFKMCLIMLVAMPSIGKLCDMHLIRIRINSISCLKVHKLYFRILGDLRVSKKIFFYLFGDINQWVFLVRTYIALVQFPLAINASSNSSVLTATS